MSKYIIKIKSKYFINPADFKDNKTRNLLVS